MSSNLMYDLSTTTRSITLLFLTQRSNKLSRTYINAADIGRHASKFGIILASSPSSNSSSSARKSNQNDIAPDTLIGNRYKVIQILGRGGNGVTYRCHDTETQRSVAIKALSLRSLRDWKQLDLFQREAKILENLDHPGIPRYIDAFEEDTATDKAFFLVQEEVSQGITLESLINSGWRADEPEIQRIACDLLQIVQYLGARRPPVIHRDIKPSNIVIEGGKTGGRVFLIDFGGVQASVASTDGDGVPGSTVVGTYGFMAPEQFRGAARPASDLYGVGATLLYLLSGKAPSAFPIDRMRIDTSSVTMGKTMEFVVNGLLEPVLEDRIPVEIALDILRGKRKVSDGGIARKETSTSSSVGGSLFRGEKTGNNVGDGVMYSSQQQYWQQQGNTLPSPKNKIAVKKPARSRASITKRGPFLEIFIPPSQWDGNTAATGGFAVAWNSFVAFWTVGAFTGGGILFALFSIPFWFAGASLLKQAFGRHFVKEKLVISLDTWKIQQQLAVLDTNNSNQPDWSGEGNKKEASGKTEGIDCVYASMVDQSQGRLELQYGPETYYFGEGLDVAELEWFANVIQDHLQELKDIRNEIGELVDDDAIDDRGYVAVLGDSEKSNTRFNTTSTTNGSDNTNNTSDRRYEDDLNRRLNIIEEEARKTAANARAAGERARLRAEEEVEMAKKEIEKKVGEITGNMDKKREAGWSSSEESQKTVRRWDDDNSSTSTIDIEDFDVY